MPVTTQHLIAGSSFTPSSKRRDDGRYLEGLVKGKVIRVVDADTLLVRYTDYSGIDSVRYVRAANTNAPEVRSIGDNRPLSQLNKIERNQYYYGDLAANRLREILRSYNNEILLKLDQSSDIYNRRLASYFTPSGQSIEKILAEEGLTLYKTGDKRFSGTNPTLELEILRAQRKAQKERRGIFSEGLYLPPDEFLAQVKKREAKGADITLGSLIDNIIGLIRPKHRFESYIKATNKLEERLRLLSALEEDIYTSRLDQLRQRYGDETAKLADPIVYYKAQAFRRNTDYETYVYAKTRRNIFGEDRVILRTPVYGDITSRVFESIYQAKRVALGYELLDAEELPKFIVELDKRRAALSPVERINREVFNNLGSTISPYVALGVGLGAGIVTGMFTNVTLEALAYNLSNYGTLTEKAFAKQVQSIGKTLVNNRGRLVGSTIVGLLTGALLTAYLSNRNTQEVLNLGYPQKYSHKRLLFENPSDSLTKDLYMAVVDRLDVLINGLNVGSRGTIRTAFGNIREQPKRDSTILRTTLEGLFNVTQDLVLGTAIYYGLMIPAQQAVQSLLSGVFHYTLASFGGADRIRSTPIGSSLLALHQEVVATFRRAQAQNAFLGLFGRLGAAVGLDINITTPVQGGVVSKNLIKFDNFSSFEEFVSKIDSQLINPAEHMKVYGADPTAYLMPDAAGILKTIGFRFGGPGRQVSFTVNKDRLWEGFIGRTKEEKLASAQRFADALNDLFSIIGYENYGNLQLSSGLTYTADQLLGAARDQLKQAQIQKAMSQVYANPLRWFGIVPAGAESTEVSMAAVFGSTGFIARTVGYAVGRPPVLRLSPASSTIKTTLDEIKYLIDRFRGVATPEQLQAIKTSRNILTTRAMLMHRGASTQDLEQINEIINTVVRDPKHPTDQITSLLLQTRYRTSFGTKLARAGASALIYGLLFTYMFKTSTGLDATTQFGDAIAQLGLEFPVPNDTPLINIGWSSVSIRIRDSKTGEIREEERTPWFNRFVYSAFVGYSVFSYFAFEGQASILKAGAAQVLAAIPGARRIPAISTFIRDSFDEYFQQAGLRTALNKPLRAADFTDLTALLKYGPNFTQKLTASKVLAGRGFRALLGAAGALTAISLIAGLFNSISYSLKVASLGGMYQEGKYVDPTLQARLEHLWNVYQERYFESPNRLRTRGLAPIYTYDVIRMLDIDSAQQGESQGILRQAGTQQIGSIYATTLFGYDITRNRMRFTTGMQLPLYTMGVGFDLPVQIILKEPTEAQLRYQQRDVSIFRYPILPYIGDNNALTPIPIPFTGGKTGRFVYAASSTLAEFYKSYAALKVAYSRIIIPTKLLKAAGNKVISVFDHIASQILARNQSAFFNTVADSITVAGEIIGGTLYAIGENVTDNIFVKILKFTHDLAKFTLDVSTSALRAYLSQGSRLVGQFRYSLVQGSKQALERFLNKAVQNSAAQAGTTLQSSTLTFTRSQAGNIAKGIGNITISTYLGELVGQQIFGVEGVGGAAGLAVSLLQTIHSIEVTRQVNKFIKTDPRFAIQAGVTNLDDIAIANLRAAIETKEQALRVSTKIGGVIPRPTARNLGALATLVLGAAVLYGAFENSNRRIPKKLRLPEGAYRFSIDLTVIPGYQALTTRKVIFRYADGTEVERRIPKLFNLPIGGIYLPQKIDIGQLLKQLTGVSDRALDFYSVKAKLRAYNTYGDPIADLIDPGVLGPRVDYTRDRNLISIFTRPFKILFDRTYFGNTLTDASGGGGIHLGFGGATARQYDGNAYVGSSYMQFQGAVSDISFAENIIRNTFKPGILQSVLGDSALMLLNDQITFVGVSDEDRDALIAGLLFAGLPTKPLPKPRQFSPLIHKSVYRILSGNRATTAALARREDYLAWLANANQLDLAMMYNRTPYRKDVDEEGKSAGFLPGFPDGFSFFLAGALRFPNHFTSPVDREYGRSLESTFYEGIEITGRERSLLLVGQDVALGPAKTIGLIAGATLGTLIGIGVAARVLDRVYQASGQAITRNLGILNSTYANLNALIPETVEHLASAARMAQAVKVEGLISETGAFNVTIGGARQLSYVIPVPDTKRYGLIYGLTDSIEKGQTVIGTILSERQRVLTSFWGLTPEEGFGGLLKSVKGVPNARQIDVLIKQLNELKKNLSASPFGLISNEQLELVNETIEKIARFNRTNADTVRNLLINSFGINPKLTAELTSSVDEVLSAAQKYKTAIDSRVASEVQSTSKQLANSMNALASKLRAYTQTILNQLPVQSVGHFGAGMSLADRVVEIGTGGLAKRTEDVIGAVPISTRPPFMTGEASLLNAARNKLAAARQSFYRLTTSPSARVRATVATKTTTKVFGNALNATPYALAALKATDLFSNNVAPTRAAIGTVESIEAVGQYAVTAFLLNKLLTLTTLGLAGASASLAILLGGSTLLGGLAAAAIGIAVLGTAGFIAAETGIDKNKNFSLFHALGKAFSKASRKKGSLGAKGRVFLGSLWESLGNTAEVVFRRAGQGLDYLAGLEIPFTGGYSYKTFRRDSIRALANLGIAVREAADEGNPLASSLINFMTPISNTREAIAVAAYRRYRDINRRMAEGNASLLESIEAITFGIITNNLLTPSNPLILMDMKETRDKYRYFSPFVPAGGDVLNNRLESLLAELANQLDYALGNADMPLISALTYGIPNQRPNSVEGLRNSALLSSNAGVQRAASRFRPISMVTQATALQLEIRSQLAAQVFADSYYRALYINRNLDDKRFFKEERIPDAIFPESPNYRMRYKPPKSRRHTVRGIVPPLPLPPTPPPSEGPPSGPGRPPLPGTSGGLSDAPLNPSITQSRSTTEGRSDSIAKASGTGGVQSGSQLQQDPQVQSRVERRPTRGDRQQSQTRASLGIFVNQYSYSDSVVRITSYSLSNLTLLSPTISSKRVERQVTRQAERQVSRPANNIGVIDSGLVTGPAGAIGVGAAYHIDIKFSKSLPIEKKVALLDAIALGYRAQGRVIEFSNSAVSGLVYNPDAPFEERAKLLQRAEAAHSHSVYKDFTSIDYYTPRQGSNRFEDTSLRGGPILVPVLPGLKLKYGSGSGYGNYVVGIDSEGNILYKVGHGDSRRPLPADRVISSEQIRELKTTTVAETINEKVVEIVQQKDIEPAIQNQVSRILSAYRQTIKPRVPSGNRVPFDLAFLNKAKQIAGNLGVNPDYLLAVISFETGGTFRSDIQNPRSLATGLIQFTPSTASRLGYTIDELKTMTPHEQLDVVEKYLKPYKGKLNTLESVYMAVLYPAAIDSEPNTVLFKRGTRLYAQNIGLDVNRDGVITVGEAVSKVLTHLGLVQTYQANLLKPEDLANHDIDLSKVKYTKTSFTDTLTPPEPNIRTQVKEFVSRKSSEVVEKVPLLNKFTKDRLDFIDSIISGSITFEEFLTKPPLTTDELRLLDQRIKEDEGNPLQKLLGFSVVLGTLIGSGVLSYRAAKAGIGALENVVTNLKEKVNQLNETKKQKRILRESVINEQLSEQLSKQPNQSSIVSEDSQKRVSNLARQRLQAQRIQAKRRVAQIRARYKFNNTVSGIFKPTQPTLDLYPTELGLFRDEVSSPTPDQVQNRVVGTAIVPIRETKTRDALIEDTRPNFRRLPGEHSRSGSPHTKRRNIRPYVFKLPTNRSYSALSFIRAVSSAIDPTVDAAKISDYEVIQPDSADTHTALQGKYSIDPKTGLGIIRLTKDLDERLSRGKGLQNKTDLEILVREIGRHHYRARGLHKQVVGKSSLELHIQALLSGDFRRIMYSTKEYRDRIKELRKASASRGEINQAILSYKQALNEELFVYNFGKKYRKIASDLYNQLRFYEQSTLITPVKRSDVQAVVSDGVQGISGVTEPARSRTIPVSAQPQSTTREVVSSTRTSASLIQIPTRPVFIVRGSRREPTSTPTRRLTLVGIRPITEEIVSTELLSENALKIADRLKRIKETHIKGKEQVYFRGRHTKERVEIFEAIKLVNQYYVSFLEDLSKSYSESLYNEVLQLIEKVNWQVGSNRDLANLDFIKQVLPIHKPTALRVTPDLLNLRGVVIPDVWGDLGQFLPQVLVRNRVPELGRVPLIEGKVERSSSKSNELIWYSLQQELLGNRPQLLIPTSPVQALINQLDVDSGTLCYVCNYKYLVNKFSVTDPTSIVPEGETYSQITTSLQHTRDINYETKKTGIIDLRKHFDVSVLLPKYIIIDAQIQNIDLIFSQPETPIQLLDQNLYVTDNTLRSQAGVVYRGRGRSIASKVARSPKATDIKTRPVNKSTKVLRSSEITIAGDKLHLVLREGERIIAELKTSELVAHDLTHLITGYNFTREGELKAVEWEVNQFTKEVSDFEVDIYDNLYKVPGEVKILLLGGYKKLGEGSKVTINFYGDRFDIDFNYIATDDRSSLSAPYYIGNNRYAQQNPTSPLQHTWDVWVELLGNRNNIKDTTGYSGLSRTYTKVAARNRITYDLVTKLPQVGLQPAELATKKNQLLQLADQLGIKVYLNEDFTKQGLKPDIQGFYRKGEVHIASGLSPELEVRVLAHELRHAAQDIQGKLTGNLDRPTKPGGASRRTIFERQAEGAQGNVDITIRRLEKLTKRFPTRIREDNRQRNRVVSLSGSTPQEYEEFTPQILYKTKFFTSNKKPSFTVLGFVRELSRTIDPTVNVELLADVLPAPYEEFGTYQLGEYYREEGATSGYIRLRQDLYDRLNVGLATLEDLEIVTHELGHFHFDVKGRSVEIANSTLEDVERAVNRSPFRDRILGSVAELKGDVRVYINQLDLSDPRHQKLAEDALDLLKVKMYEEFVVYPFGEVYTELAKSIYDKFDFFSVGEATPTLYSRSFASNLSSKTTEKDISDSIVRLSKPIDEQTAFIRRKNLNRFNGTDPRGLLRSGLVESNKELSSNDLPENADASQSIRIQGKVNNRQLPLTQSNQRNLFGDYKHRNKYPVKGSLDFVDPVADPSPVFNLSTLSTRFELTGGNQYGLQANPVVSQPVGITEQRYTFSNDFALPSVATVPNAVVDNAQAFRTGSGFVSSAGNAYDIAGTIAGVAQQTFNLSAEQTFGVGVATGALYLAGSSGVLGEKVGAGIVAAVEGQGAIGSTVINNVVTRKLQLGGPSVVVASQGATVAGALYAGDYTRVTQQQLISSTSGAVASLIAGKLYSLAAVSLLGGPKGWAASAVLLLTGLAVQMSAGSLISQAVAREYMRGALKDTLKQTPRYYDQNARVITTYQRRTTPRQDRIGAVGPGRLLINAERKLEKDIREIYNSVRGSVEALIRANLEADLIAVEAAIQNLAGTTDRSKIRKRQRLTKWRNSLVNSIENNLDKLTDEYINRQVELLKQQIALDDKPAYAVRNALIDAVVTAHRINEAARGLTNLNNQAEEERLRLIRGIVLSDDQEVIKDGHYPGLSDYLVQQAYKQEVQQRNKVTKQEKELREQSSQSGQNTNVQRRVDVIQPDLGQPRDVRLERGKGTVDPAKKHVEPKIISATKAAIVQVSPTAAAVVTASAELISNLRKVNLIEKVQTFFKFNRGKEQVMNSDPAVQSSNPNGHIDPAKN